MQSLGIAGKHGRFPDVVEAQVEHADALHADAAAGVRRAAVTEGLDVVLDGVDGDPVVFGSLAQKVRIVDTLSSGQDLLSAHKHVVRIGPLVVVGIRHGVKRTNRQRELVQDVKVRVVLLADQSP